MKSTHKLHHDCTGAFLSKLSCYDDHNTSKTLNWSLLWTALFQWITSLYFTPSWLHICVLYVPIMVDRISLSNTLYTHLNTKQNASLLMFVTQMLLFFFQAPSCKRQVNKVTMSNHHSNSYCLRCILWMISLQSLNTRRMFSVSTAHVKCG